MRPLSWGKSSSPRRFCRRRRAFPVRGNQGIRLSPPRGREPSGEGEGALRAPDQDAGDPPMIRETLFQLVSDLALAIQAASAYPENHPRVQDLLGGPHKRL